MITENEIYWVMQMDKICATLHIVCVIGGLGAFFSSLGMGFIYMEGSKIITKRFLFLFSVWFFLLISALTAYTFTPSSKTVAAMKVLPKIVNNEEIQTECSELYGIAKKALKNIEEGE